MQIKICEAHFANYTNELKLQIGATHTSRYMSVYFWSTVLEIFAMHWAVKQIRMAQDYYTTKQLKSKNIPSLNTGNTTIHRTTIHGTTIYRTTVHRNDSSSNDNSSNDNLSKRQFIELTVYRTDSSSNRQFIEPTVHRTDSLSNDDLSNNSLSKRLIWFNCCKTLLRRGHHAVMYSCSQNCLLNFAQVQSPFLSFFIIDWYS